MPLRMSCNSLWVPTFVVYRRFQKILSFGQIHIVLSKSDTPVMKTFPCKIHRNLLAVTEGHKVE